MQKKDSAHVDSVPGIDQQATGGQVTPTPHSPLPWSVCGTTLSPLYASVVTADGVEFMHDDDTLMSKADAEFIVRACNAHDELLAALKAVVDMFGPWHDDDCPADDTCDCSSKPIHDAINAAIAKAEGRS
jgi:hypothetical protein